jgi:hypothetical protein
MEPEISQLCEGNGYLVLKLCIGVRNPIILCKLHLHSEAIAIVVAYSGRIVWRTLSFTVTLGFSERVGGGGRVEAGAARARSTCDAEHPSYLTFIEVLPESRFGSN